MRLLKSHILNSNSGAGTAYPSGAHEFTPRISGVRVTRSLVLCISFVDRCLSFCTFSFGHCVDCSSSIYGFWLTLWYLQTLLTRFHIHGLLRISSPGIGDHTRFWLFCLGPLGFLVPKDFYITWHSHILALSVSVKGYSKNEL